VSVNVTPVAGEFVDAGISGAKEHRPGLDKLPSLCRKRLVDAVVVYRYDRFARSLRQLVNALEEFRILGVDFISIHEGVDTTTANGRLVFGIFAVGTTDGQAMEAAQAALMNLY
jgi:DNA invertase Pin-like site-specific DNA recombinase